MAKATAGAALAPSIAVPASGGGSPLPASTRSFMDPRFGADFGSVRVHADAAADRMSRAIGAEAFTLGSDIYFRAGRFQPSTAAGDRLLAHELAHVVQQSRGAVSRKVQRYTLSGFPAAEEGAMKAAIPIASATMRSCGGHTSIASKVDSATYEYNTNLGACGYTYPVPWANIEIGSSAFSVNRCCKLESTTRGVAHAPLHRIQGTQARVRLLLLLRLMLLH